MHTQLKTTLFLKSLDYKHLSHTQRVSHDFLSLRRSLLSPRSLLSLRAGFSCHTFFPGTKEKTSRKKKKSILFSSGLGGSLSLFSTDRLVEISFALTFSLFLLFSSSVSCACVCVVGARQRWRARRRRGCRWMLAGRGGVARSAVAVFVARRRVCLETQGKHEWALFCLHLKN